MKKKNIETLGDCRDENLVNEIFGSVSEFARLVEECGNNFVYQGLEVFYDGKQMFTVFLNLINF